MTGQKAGHFTLPLVEVGMNLVKGYVHFETFQYMAIPIEVHSFEKYRTCTSAVFREIGINTIYTYIAVLSHICLIH